MESPFALQEGGATSSSRRGEEEEGKRAFLPGDTPLLPRPLPGWAEEEQEIRKEKEEEEDDKDDDDGDDDDDDDDHEDEEEDEERGEEEEEILQEEDEEEEREEDDEEEEEGTHGVQDCSVRHDLLPLRHRHPPPPAPAAPPSGALPRILGTRRTCTGAIMMPSGYISVMMPYIGGHRAGAAGRLCLSVVSMVLVEGLLRGCCAKRRCRDRASRSSCLWSADSKRRPFRFRRPFCVAPVAMMSAAAAPPPPPAYPPVAAVWPPRAHRPAATTRPRTRSPFHSFRAAL